jgi:hypothetical protein
MGTNWREGTHSCPRIFKFHTGGAGRRKNRGALRDQDPLSERLGSQGPRSLKQKRQLFPALQLDISRKANALRLGGTQSTTTPHVQVPE